jgi:hypothetical protein
MRGKSISKRKSKKAPRHKKEKYDSDSELHAIDSLQVQTLLKDEDVEFKRESPEEVCFYRLFRNFSGSKLSRFTEFLILRLNSF